MDLFAEFVHEPHPIARDRHAYNLTHDEANHLISNGIDPHLIDPSEFDVEAMREAIQAGRNRVDEYDRTHPDDPDVQEALRYDWDETAEDDLYEEDEPDFEPREQLEHMPTDSYVLDASYSIDSPARPSLPIYIDAPIAERDAMYPTDSRIIRDIRSLLTSPPREPYVGRYLVPTGDDSSVRVPTSIQVINFCATSRKQAQVNKVAVDRMLTSFARRYDLLPAATHRRGDQSPTLHNLTIAIVPSNTDLQPEQGGMYVPLSSYSDIILLDESLLVAPDDAAIVHDHEMGHVLEQLSASSPHGRLSEHTEPAALRDAYGNIFTDYAHTNPYEMFAELVAGNLPRVFLELQGFKDKTTRDYSTSPPPSRRAQRTVDDLTADIYAGRRPESPADARTRREILRRALETTYPGLARAIKPRK